MRMFFLFTLCVVTPLIKAQEKSYNILSFDGGAIKGVISANCLLNIEKYAYDYAVEKGYDFPRHANNPNTMHMTDLFDMIAGTSIGSITASALSIPSDKNATAPKWYAKDIIDIYTT